MVQNIIGAVLGTASQTLQEVNKRDQWEKDKKYKQYVKNLRKKEAEEEASMGTFIDPITRKRTKGNQAQEAGATGGGQKQYAQREKTDWEKFKEVAGVADQAITQLGPQVAQGVLQGYMASKGAGGGGAAGGLLSQIGGAAGGGGAEGGASGGGGGFDLNGLMSQFGGSGGIANMASQYLGNSGGGGAAPAAEGGEGGEGAPDGDGAGGQLSGDQINSMVSKFSSDPEFQKLVQSQDSSIANSQQFGDKLRSGDMGFIGKIISAVKQLHGDFRKFIDTTGDEANRGGGRMPANPYNDGRFGLKDTANFMTMASNTYNNARSFMSDKRLKDEIFPKEWLDDDTVPVPVSFDARGSGELDDEVMYG